MANRPIRPKPDHLHECPIFRNNRLFVGYAYGARECWFGCISEQTASREGSQRAIEWFRIWISDTSEDVLQNGVFSVEQEDPNVTRLADKDKDDPALATLGHDQRVERYGRVLDDIDRGRTKVREHENSSTCRIIDKPFILRPPPGNRGRLESDGGIRTAKKRKRRGDEEDADVSAGEPKAMRMSSMGSHFTSGLQEDEDDEEPHPIGQGVEVKTEENNESGQTAPDVGEREVQGEPVVPTIVEPARIVPMNIRLMHLREAIDAFILNEYAIPQKPQAVHMISNAYNGQCATLDSPYVLVSLAREIAALFVEPKENVKSALKHEVGIVKHLERCNLPEAVARTARDALDVQMRYLDFVEEKTEAIGDAIREIERGFSGEGDGEEL